MFRFRRVMLLAVVSVLVGGSTVGMSRPACGHDFDGESLAIRYGNLSYDAGTGFCVDGNDGCGGFQF